MKNYPDYDLVQKCLLRIEEKLKWGDSDQWHSEVFIELSESIQETTNVLLSPTTLKRIWGKVNYNSAPSINTLNTLSQFAGYTNWRDFKIKSEAPKEISKKTNRIKKSISNKGIIITSAACLTILFISLFSLVSFEKDPPFPDLERIKFSSRPLAEGIPNSVVFDFELLDIESDSIYIQQFWDVTKTIKINADQKQATGIYYFPGYFKAKLLVDGQILKEHDLFLKSKDWLRTIDYDPVPKYSKAAGLKKEHLSFSEEMLEEIKSIQEPHTSSFHLVDDFDNLSGDNFTMESSIRNVYHDKWAVCQSTKIVILGTEGAFIIPFSIPGCVSDIGLMLNDVYRSGKKHDLSAFGFDFSNFRTVKIKVEQKEVEIFVDGHKIHTSSYNESIGRLIGVRYRFLGAGEIKDLTIKNDRDIIKHSCCE